MELPTVVDSFAVSAEEAERITLMLEKQFAARFTDQDKGFVKAIKKDPDDPIIVGNWVGNEGRRSQHRDRFVRDADNRWGRGRGRGGGGGRGEYRGRGRGGRGGWRGDRRDGRWEDGDQRRRWGRDRRDDDDRRERKDDRRDDRKHDRSGDRKDDRNRDRSGDRKDDRNREVNRDGEGGRE